MIKTTFGQFLINEQLPPKLRDYNRVFDKKTIRTMFEQAAGLESTQYRDINDNLHRLASEAVTLHGGNASLSLDSMRTPEEILKIRKVLNDRVNGILDQTIPVEEKRNKIIGVITKEIDNVNNLNYQHGLKEGNPFALQILSGARGNESQFRSIRAGDMMFVDHKDRPIPIPVLRSYSEGLDPVHYWAGAYGARKGAISVKFATPEAGYLGKQMILASHRLVVTEPDCGTKNGIQVKASDADNEGAVLATGLDKFSSGTILSPKIIKEIGDKDVTIRSPITCQASSGICQKCAGVRERGGFPPIGDNVGIAAAQAISEPIGQGQLGVKHGGGLAGVKSVKTGLDLIDQLVNVPETFQGGAAISDFDGKVERIYDAPQGGKFVIINGNEHWVSPDYNLKVKVGDNIEAGDVLSEGIPNPAKVTQHKGIGEGRKYFVDILNSSLREGGFPAHRRNVELLSRGMINHVRITDPDGPSGSLPNDIVEYDSLIKNYTPRKGTVTLASNKALGNYLEEPILHYSIGTKITPRIANSLQSSNIKSVKVHSEKPPFVPEMVRAMETLSHSDDWMVRMGGLYGVRRSFVKSVHRTGESNLHGTSFIPPLAQGIEFGKSQKEY